MTRTTAITRAALVFALACLFSAAASASCYTVLNPKGTIVYQSPEPPVDMSLPLHQTVPVRFGKGTTMVFEVDRDDCSPINVAPGRVGGPASVDQAMRDLARRNLRERMRPDSETGAAPSVAF